MISISFLLMCLVVKESQTRVNPHGPTVVNDFANCVINIIEIDFKHRGLLIFADTNDVGSSVSRIREQLLQYLHKEIRFSVQISSPEDQGTICGKNDEDDIGVLHRDHFETVPEADYFILIIDKYEDFTRVASKIIRSRSWNSKAKFIILFLRFAKTESNIQYVEKMFSCLYNFNVIDIIVILPHETNIRSALVYGWRPYDPPKYCGYFNESAKNRSFVLNTCEKGYLKTNRSVYLDQLPMDMTGCTLKILALERQPFVSGNEDDFNMEQYLVNEVLKTYNFRTEYDLIHSFRGERYAGEWDGALKLLTSKKGHILLGGIFPDFDVHEDFEASTFYLSDSYTWVVPRAHASPRWVALFIIFNNFVWFCFCMTFIVCLFAWLILGYLSRDESRLNRYLGHCFLNTWACTLGVCSYIRPKKGSLRTFYVFLNLYCMLNMTAYQTKLIDVLRNPTFEYQIKTVEELIESGLKFGGSEDLHDLFHNSSDPIDNLIGEEWINVEDIRGALIDVAIHRNFSLMCSVLELTHMSAIMPELSDNFGNFRYYKFSRSMFTVPMEMIALRGYPYMKSFSERLSTLRQSGINAAVRRSFKGFNTRRRFNLLRSLTDKQATVGSLSIEHLQGGFLALVLGYISGIIILCAEIVCDTNYVKTKISICRNKFYKKIN